MFTKLVNFLRGRPPLDFASARGEGGHDLQVAATAFLLEMAGADHDYAPEETDAILSLLRQCFHLTADDAASLIERADGIRAVPEKLEEHLRLIQERYQQNERESLFALVWSVVLADGRVDVEEARYCLLLKSRLALSDEAVERAKQLGDTIQRAF